MTKTDWIDYFEAVNGRSPSDLEIAQAMEAGEFDDEMVAVSPVVESVEDRQVLDDLELTSDDELVQDELDQSSSVTEPTEVATAQEQIQPQQTQHNQPFNKIKEQSLSYFDWFVRTLKNPTNAVEEAHFGYSLVTLGLAAIPLGVAIINAFRRILFSTANLSVAGESLAQQSPEDYARFTNLIRQQFGFGKMVTIALYLFVLYALVVLLPTLVQKWSQTNDKNVKEVFSHNSLLFPAVVITNVCALGLSFLIPNQLSILGKHMQSIQNLLVSISGGEFRELNQLLEEIPALAAVKSSVTYMMYSILVGFVFLLVTVVKRSKGSFAKLHDLYVRALSLLIFLLAVYMINGKILGLLVESFNFISAAISGGF